MGLHEELNEAYLELDKHRKFRNKWIAIGAGGIAVGGIVAVSTGNYVHGALIAMGSVMGAESVALDSFSAVSDTRRIISLINSEAQYTSAPEVSPTIIAGT